MVDFHTVPNKSDTLSNRLVHARYNDYFVSPLYQTLAKLESMCFHTTPFRCHKIGSETY